jgi:hypothetical protein
VKLCTYIRVCFVFNDLFSNPTTFSLVNFHYLVVTITKVVICITPGPKGPRSSFSHIITLYLTCIIVYLLTSWTDLTIKYNTWYPVLFTPLHHFFLISTYCVCCMCNLQNQKYIRNGWTLGIIAGCCQLMEFLVHRVYHIIQCWISQLLFILAVYFDTCRWYFVVQVCWWSNLYW